MFVDAHGDILTDVMQQAQKGVDIWNQYHKQRYQQAGINTSIFVNFTDPNSKQQQEDFFNINKIALPYFKNHPDFNIILNGDEFQADKFNLILGIEGMGAVSTSAELDELYELGYRHFGITWNEQNSFASGCGYDGGLTAAGSELIKYANRKGIIVDFAHLNYKSFIEAAKVTSKPILFSHGNVKALCDNVRNLDDEQLQLVANSNGVIGLAVLGFFLNENPQQASIDDLIEHIMYLRSRIGIDHIGFGFDFCHYLGSHQSKNNVEGLEQINDVYKIPQLLEKRGLSSVEIDKITHLNMLRVFKAHLN